MGLKLISTQVLLYFILEVGVGVELGKITTRNPRIVVHGLPRKLKFGIEALFGQP